jgi:hypothetical protein
MKTLILVAAFVFGCSDAPYSDAHLGDPSPKPSDASIDAPTETGCQEAPDGSRAISPAFRAWMQAQACANPSYNFSANDPCSPGTVTISCPYPPNRYCLTWGGPVTCGNGSLFYGPLDHTCQCIHGASCLAIPLTGEPEQGVCP